MLLFYVGFSVCCFRLANSVDICILSWFGLVLCGLRGFQVGVFVGAV